MTDGSNRLALRFLLSFHQLAVIQSKPAPFGMRPQGTAYSVFGIQERAVSRVDICRQIRRMAIFGDARTLDHEHALETPGLANVVRDAEKRRVAPELAGTIQQ